MVLCKWKFQNLVIVLKYEGSVNPTSKRIFCFLYDSRIRPDEFLGVGNHRL
jgi:hypothetical protein